MIQRNAAELSLDQVTALLGESAVDPITPLARILSEGLIIYVRLDPVFDYVVGFAYEAFFEYVVALYYLQRVWSTRPESEITHEFAELMEEAKKSRSLRGALEFVILFMEGRQGGIHVELILALAGSRSDLEIVGCNAI